MEVAMSDGRAEAAAAAPGIGREHDDDADLVRVDVVDVKFDGLLEVEGAFVVEYLRRGRARPSSTRRATGDAGVLDVGVAEDALCGPEEVVRAFEEAGDLGRRARGHVEDSDEMLVRVVVRVEPNRHA